VLQSNPRFRSVIQPVRAQQRRLALLALLALSSTLAHAAEPAPAPTACRPGSAGCDAGAAALVGTWTLQAADDLRPDGARVPAYGEHPQGILMVDASGQYSLQIYRTDRAKFASGDKKHATPQEYEMAVIGMSAHVSHIALDPASGIVTFAIDLSAFPNWEGTAQKRQYRLEHGPGGDTLSYQNPAAASSGGNIPVSVWKKVR